MRNCMPLITLLFVTTWVSNGLAALAPWWINHNEWSQALKSDSCFQVEDPQVNGLYTKMAIEVCSKEKARAWETIKSEHFTTSTDKVFFTHNSETVEKLPLTGDKADKKLQLKKIVQTALKDLAVFQSAHVQMADPIFYPHDITLEFKAVVIQTFVDNTFDLWGQRNLTAQDHFAELIRSKVEDLQLGFTSTKKMN